MITVNTQIHPFRLLLKRREPVSLMIELLNETEREQIISYDVVLGNHLAFDRQGLVNAQTKRVDSLRPGEKVRNYFSIYPKVNAEPGVYPVLLTVTEHYRNYTYILGKKKKRLILRVE